MPTPLVVTEERRRSRLATTLLLARLMTSYGVPATIVNAMLTTRQPDMYWVGAADGWTEVEVLEE